MGSSQTSSSSKQDPDPVSQAHVTVKRGHVRKILGTPVIIHPSFASSGCLPRTLRQVDRLPPLPETTLLLALPLKTPWEATHGCSRGEDAGGVSAATSCSGLGSEALGLLRGTGWKDAPP